MDEAEAPRRSKRSRPDLSARAEAAERHAAALEEQLTEERSLRKAAEERVAQLSPGTS